jgi:hypothetical protein
MVDGRTKGYIMISLTTDGTLPEDITCSGTASRGPCTAGCSCGVCVDVSGARDTCQAGINGRYVYAQQHSGKAVYRRDYTASYGQTSIYLFWSTENGDARWELCDGIEICGTFAYAGEFGAGPTNLDSGQWFESCNSQWTIGSIVVSPDCS